MMSLLFHVVIVDQRNTARGKGRADRGVPAYGAINGLVRRRGMLQSPLMTPIAQGDTIVVDSTGLAQHAGEDQRVKMIGVRLDKVRVEGVVVEIALGFVADRVSSICTSDQPGIGPGRVPAAFSVTVAPGAQRRKPMGLPQPSRNMFQLSPSRLTPISLPLNMVLASGMEFMTHKYRHLAC